jgi:methionine sulfoxide reductase heme-binding subunit
MTGYSAKGPIEGWRLLRTLVLAIVGLSIGTYALSSADVEGIRAVIRLTARMSLLLFLAAFVASAAHRLANSRSTAWLRRNRRQLGLGFAFSHLVHAAAIIAFWRLDPEIFLAGRTAGSYIPGALGYVFIIAMAATSFDATAKAIGPRAWKWLHTAGVWYLFVQFCVAFGTRVGATPAYAGFLLILAFALCVRLAGWIRKRRDAARSANSPETYWWLALRPAGNDQRSASRPIKAV